MLTIPRLVILPFLFMMIGSVRAQENADSLKPVLPKMYPDSLEEVRITLTNRRHVDGKFLKANNDTVFLLVDLVGEIPIAKSNIKTVLPQQLPELRCHQVLFTPTGRPMEKGSVQYTNSMLFLNRVDVGITKWLSGGVGGVLLPDLLMAGASLRASFPLSDVVHVGVGHFFVYAKDWSEPFWNMPYVALSLGKPHAHVDFYYSRAFFDSGNDIDHMAGVSGQIPLRNNQSLVLNGCMNIATNYHYTLHPSGGIWWQRSTYVNFFPTIGYRKNWSRMSLDAGIISFFYDWMDREFLSPYISLTLYSLPDKYTYTFMPRKSKRAFTSI